jgi:hypothetical protein
MLFSVWSPYIGILFGTLSRGRTGLAAQRIDGFGNAEAC